MSYLKILITKPHNSHFLMRYVKFIEYCNKQNIDKTVKLVNHHICPKASDLFPKYANLSKYPWNRARLSDRQHYIAHYMLWKAFQGSQTNAFHAMNNKGTYRKLSSKLYETLKEEAYLRNSTLNKGYAVYIDSTGNKVRCKNTDPMVLSKELVSTTKGRFFTPRTVESRLKTGASLTGKNTGPMSAEERIARRTHKTQVELYFDKASTTFIEIDPLFISDNMIKVFTGKRKVWDATGKFRNISDHVPVPPGYFNTNPIRLLRGINLTDMTYVEVTVGTLLPNFCELPLCKTGKKMVTCVTLSKKIYLPEEWIAQFGLPVNCLF
jgi:hypothetical protein